MEITDNLALIITLGIILFMVVNYYQYLEKSPEEKSLDKCYNYRPKLEEWQTGHKEEAEEYYKCLEYYNDICKYKELC